jgi:hypothetical protein
MSSLRYFAIQVNLTRYTGFKLIVTQERSNAANVNLVQGLISRPDCMFAGEFPPCASHSWRPVSILTHSPDTSHARFSGI